MTREGWRSSGGICDQSLLDSLEALPTAPFEGRDGVGVRATRIGIRSCTGGREGDGTMACWMCCTPRRRERAPLPSGDSTSTREIRFPPSRVRHELFELWNALKSVILFAQYGRVG